MRGGLVYIDEGVLSFNRRIFVFSLVHAMLLGMDGQKFVPHTEKEMKKKVNSVDGEVKSDFRG